MSKKINKNKTIFLASSNLDKLEDFKIVFEKIGIELKQVERLFPVKETANTLIENAKAKALVHSSHFPNKIIMATDGGVKIPYLGNKWNYILTKRLSGIDKESKLSDRKRVEVLLDLMKDAVSDEERMVIWEEAIVLSYNGKIIFKLIEKGSPGILLKEIPPDFAETGYGIGYLWFCPEKRKTYMQLTESEKVEHSIVKKQLLKKLRNFNFTPYF